MRCFLDPYQVKVKKLRDLENSLESITETVIQLKNEFIDMLFKILFCFNF